MTRALLIVLLIFVHTVCVAAQIHRWTDEQGRVHFGDRPPAGVASRSVTVRPNVYQSPSIEGLASLFEGNEGVVLYSAAWCVYCHKARAYLQANAVPFEEYDVETSPRGIRDYKRLAATGVPVILVGKRRLNGFSASAFEAIYRSRP